MALDDRRAGLVLLAMAGAALAAFGAIRLLQGPDSSPLPRGTAPAPAPPPGAPQPPMEFVLCGRVLGPGGKAPVPGAAVEVVPRAGRHEALAADGKGAFVWRSKDPTPAAVIWARAPGIGLGHCFVQGAPGREMEQSVVLVAPRPQAVFVRDAAGGPVEGAEVRVLVGGPDAPSFPGTGDAVATGKDGRCTPEVPPGIPLHYLARSADGVLAGETAVEIAPAPPAPVEIVLRPKAAAGK